MRRKSTMPVTDLHQSSPENNSFPEGNVSTLSSHNDVTSGPIETTVLPTVSIFNANQNQISIELPALNPNDPWNQLTAKLHEFQSEHCLSKKAMNAMLKLFIDARHHPHERLDIDWRTVLSHKRKHEVEILKASIGAQQAAKSDFGEDVFVCSACAAHRSLWMKYKPHLNVLLATFRGYSVLSNFAKPGVFAPLVWGRGA
jgi:hypothetical protein